MRSSTASARRFEPRATTPREPRLRTRSGGSAPRPRPKGSSSGCSRSRWWRTSSRQRPSSSRPCSPPPPRGCSRRGRARRKRRCVRSRGCSAASTAKRSCLRLWMGLSSRAGLTLPLLPPPLPRRRRRKRPREAAAGGFRGSREGRKSRSQCRRRRRSSSDPRVRKFSRRSSNRFRRCCKWSCGARWHGRPPPSLPRPNCCVVCS
mmetsp:Transcript_14584/g.47875  ORF Transcript_14584/g.47875 Transcript_14584/m.47875 type:complete len:205 (-) Transcript_14584:455-1069(-)